MNAPTNSKLKFGYYAAHEQYDPVTLLNLAVKASKQGFDSIWTSDHFQPWFHTGGQSGFAWVWLAALGERTENTTFGTAVTSPTRYLPAVIAQAFATLAVMYGDRVFLTLGTGEALNDVPAGSEWPRFSIRAEMVEESVQVIRRLWSGEKVDFTGRHFTIKGARLYTRPIRPVKLYIASNGPTLARLAGKLADGYLTLPVGHEHIEHVLLPALEEGARKVGRNPAEIEKTIEIEVSFDEDYDRALQSCRRWAGTLVQGSVDMTDPERIEEAGKKIGDERLAQTWVIATSPNEIIKATEAYLRMGFTHAQYLSSSPDEAKFIDMMSSRVLPYLRETYSR